MAALTFRVTLQQPVLIGRIGSGDENSAQSYDYLPGSALRGMLIQRYIQRYGSIDLTNETPNGTQFFDGQVAFLNAYPLTEKGERTLPTPKSWRVEKEEAECPQADITDLAVADHDLLESPKSPSSPFCLYSRGQAVLYKPERFTGMHNASEERFVKREGESTVFRYDALAAGKYFGGVILADDLDFLKTVCKPLLESGRFSIGRSRSAGYGRVQVDALETHDEWSEYQPEQTGKGLVLTLLSDAVLRDSYGQLTTNVWQAAGLPTPSDAFIDTDLCGGFNRKWGLPLPQVPVVAAGSVLVFEDEPAIRTQLDRLVASGIGDRRNEGFGRLALNWHRRASVVQDNPPATRSQRRPLKLDGNDNRLARTMVDRLYRAKLDEKLTELVVSRLGIREDGAPENSQLSRLRVIVRRAWREDNSDLLPQYLAGLKSTARGQLTQASVDNQRLFDWLENGWKSKIWSDYFTIAESEKPRIGDVIAQETAPLKREYTVRLIDGLCNKTIKGRTDKEGA